ncbi:SRPBCC family protein [Alkalicoccobacillus porphyridii]|uniref:SRPBCC domain-containing protein n=1 Tax=Alkalicoccobacillus porphyridii TaxID=2597270 RepID=A0A554A1W5_9BACI|nr:SRPBCC domain-containing protein [Alkalicoccobacillus porphyridii]TSB47656.1 SRPBCC domain-containing protein [Alkalicoccobacillus porphyridii]
MANDKQELIDIKKTIIIQAPIHKVWEFAATAEGIEAWFMPNNFKAEEGYEFQLQSPFGPSPCKVLEIEEPHRLSFSWDTEGWIVTFELREVDEQTEFTLTHGGWKDAGTMLPKANEKSEVIRERMAGGWVGIVEKLKKVAEA